MYEVVITSLIGFVVFCCLVDLRILALKGLKLAPLLLIGCVLLSYLVDLLVLALHSLRVALL